MSDVTNVILLQRHYHKNWEQDRLEIANQYLRDKGVGYLISVKDKQVVRKSAEGDIHPWFGGYKNLECEMAIGAMNHLNIEQFVSFLIENIRWDPEDDGTCQLVISRQWDDEFRIINIHIGT